MEFLQAVDIVFVSSETLVLSVKVKAVKKTDINNSEAVMGKNKSCKNR